MQRCVPDVRGGVPNNLMNPHAAIADSTRQHVLMVGRTGSVPDLKPSPLLSPICRRLVADARLTNMPKFG